MQRLLKGAQRFLLGVFLSTVAIQAAGIDFNIFEVFSAEHGYGASNRRINTITGPSSQNRLFIGNRLVNTPSVGAYICIHGGILKRFSPADGSLVAETAPGLAINDWPMSLTYDSITRRTVLANLGGPGALYQRSENGDWSLLSSLFGEDLAAIVHDPGVNVFWGLAVHLGSARTTLIKYNSSGARLETLSLPPLPCDVGPGAARAEMFSINGLIILLVEGANASLIYVINPNTSSMELTYDASKVPPRIQLASLANQTNFEIGKPILLEIATYDPGDQVRLVELRADQVLLQSWSTWPDPITNYFSSTWTPGVAGPHEVTARAFNANGSNLWSDVRIINVIETRTFADRDLPALYVPGSPFRVTISVRPGARVSAWAIEETPPTGWSAYDVSNGGAWDAINNKVKWGPFTTTSNVTLSYFLTPPTNSSGEKVFAGRISVDGIDQDILGDRIITSGDRYHPADISQRDMRLTLNEVTSYAAAWRSGARWNYPPSEIPLSYVTRAGFIWRSSEYYSFDLNLTAPSCWVPASKPALTARAINISSESYAARTLPTAFTPGRPATITLRIAPNPQTLSYAIEELPPTGWTITDASFGSIVRGAIRCGPYFDNEERILTYTVLPPTTALSGTFAGEASFDGASGFILGSALMEASRLSLQQVPGENKIRSQVTATPGGSFIFESSDTADAAEWTEITAITGGQTPILLPDIDATGTQKFYRLRPLP